MSNGTIIKRDPVVHLRSEDDPRLYPLVEALSPPQKAQLEGLVWVEKHSLLRALEMMGILIAV